MVRNAGPGAERPAVQGGGGGRVAQDVLDLAVRGAQTRGDERSPKDVARAGAVHAIDLKRGGSNETPAAPRQTSLVAQRDARQARAEFARHGFQGAALVLVASQRGRKLLGGDDGVDLL